ncbi:MAG: hypothetical protein R3C99_01105 [Pirellulaceae bacterium]|nr:hypothetical protein [Planctomycetales bacterium]MCA9210732.1 hypothetical protein [Planctomycetales bacterium]MCA9223057.1 hypothetical protein [Planctomycetales bacterium]MCA9224062.1 hypothetical protein [Planctomycetales bacterium]
MTSANLYADQAHERLRSERRRYLRSHPNSRFVAAEVFCDLAVSARQLERMDDHAAGLRGLFDPATGEHYLTEDVELFDHQAFA